MTQFNKSVEWPNGGHTHIEITPDRFAQISDILPDRTNVRTWSADGIRKLITSHTILLDVLTEALDEMTK